MLRDANVPIQPEPPTPPMSSRYLCADLSSCVIRAPTTASGRTEEHGELADRVVNLASSHCFCLGTAAGEIPSAAAAGESETSGEAESDPSTARHRGVSVLACSRPALALAQSLSCVDVTRVGGVTERLPATYAWMSPSGIDPVLRRRDAHASPRTPESAPKGMRGATGVSPPRHAMTARRSFHGLVGCAACVAWSRPSCVTPSGEMGWFGCWFLRTVSMNSGSGMLTSAGNTAPFLSPEPKLNTGAFHFLATGHG